VHRPCMVVWLLLGRGCALCVLHVLGLVVVGYGVQNGVMEVPVGGGWLVLLVWVLVLDRGVRWTLCQGRRISVSCHW
jgi:hypothetical protein